MSKIIDILFKALHYFARESWNIIYFSFVHSHVSYHNIVGTFTFKTKLGKTITKHELRIIYNKYKYVHSRSLTRNMNVSNVLTFSRFMYKAKHDTDLSLCLNIYGDSSK